jgi:hypothetical protein
MTANKAQLDAGADDAMTVINVIGQLVNALVPGEAQVVAIATGAASLIRNTLIPMFEHLTEEQITLAEQVATKAEVDAERLRLGMKPDPIN